MKKNWFFGVLLLASQQMAAQQAIEALAFSPDAIPQGVEVRGTVVEGLHWKDANGENYFLLTRTADKVEEVDGIKKKTAFLYAYHYVVAEELFQLMRKSAEPLKECSSAVSDIYWMPQSLSLSDMDKDGKAEITFLHATVCAERKETPVPVQLTMFEDGERYSMRGTAAVRLEGATRSGSEVTELQKSVYDLGAEFKAADPLLLQYAEQQWQKYAVVKQ